MFKIQKDEFRDVLVYSVMLFFIYLSTTIGWCLIYTLLAKRFDVQYLGQLLISFSLINVILGGIYIYFSKKFSLLRIIQFTSFLCTLFLIFGALLNYLTLDPEPGTINWNGLGYFSCFLFALATVYCILPMQLWTIITETFRPIQCRRLIPLFNISILSGGIVGGLIGWKFPLYFSIELLPCVWAINIFVVFLIGFLKHSSPLEIAREPKVTSAAKKIGIRDVIKYPIAKIFIAFNILWFIVGLFQENQNTVVVNRYYTDELEMNAFLNQYYIVRNIFNIILFFQFGPWVLNRLGVFRSLLVVPLISLVGFSILLWKFDLWQAVGLHFFFEVFATVVQSMALQYVYNAFPNESRAALRGFIGSIIIPLSIISGGILITIAPYTQGILVNDYSTFITIAAIILSSVWLYVVIKGKKLYIDQIIDNVKNEEGRTLIDGIESLEEKFEPKAYDTLEEIVGEYNPKYDDEVKGKAMVIMARLGHLKALRPLYSILQEANDDLRLYAITALYQFKNIKSNPFAFYALNKEMKKILNEDNLGIVRAEAGRYLTKFMPPKDITRFADELFNQPDPYARVLAIQTIKNIDVDLIDLLILQALEDSDPFVRSEAIIALWNIEGYNYRTRPLLSELIHSSKKEEVAIGFRVLLNINDNYPSKFVKEAQVCLDDNNTNLRGLSALICLYAIKDDEMLRERCFNIILDTLSDPNFKDNERQNLLKILVKLPEDIMDEVIFRVAQLPAEQKEIAKRQMYRFGMSAEESYEEEVSKMRFVSFNLAIQ